MQLKEELPERSVSRIIQILEGEKLVPPGKIARSTLTRQLTAKGLTRQELMKDKTGHSTFFRRNHRNQMWQTDVNLGHLIPIPINLEAK